MKCTACSVLNTEEAQYCRNCGTPLYPSNEASDASSNKTVWLLLAVIASFVIVELGYFVISTFELDFIYDVINLSSFMMLIPTLTLLIAAVLTPNQKAKIALFIGFGLMLLFLAGYYIS
ncbi:zinc ribbon domain-containing protein [Cellulophaga sp. HaHa_2_1]|uniref:zinc ribbon domain-containing protein n=1 Tax=Cellulophaga sp. HaHa_2_1 TaxID=2749994 RepID=UPI001C4E5867|nr:zinc ribbon domain-containing protein [Cellulophaga sp. HaHa_2_1]QXP54117.1 zinc ribbon domain-containing protein [Cellulophaga sp. HaHa_2_1]